MITIPLWVGLAILQTGCGPRTTEFYISDHRADGPPQQYYERFDECYYCRDADGTVDIVARRRSRSAGDNAGVLTQVIHVHLVWNAIPGRTFADDSMINSTVNYLIVGPGSGASFGGGGFATFSENRSGVEIRGQLESSALAPQRRRGRGEGLFSRAAVTGTFRAKRDKRQVIRVLHEMKRLFGPLPPYQPPAVNPDLR